MASSSYNTRVNTIMALILVYFLITAPLLVWLCLYFTSEASLEFLIEDFFISDIQNNAPNSTESIIYFDLKLKNELESMGAYYNDINLTFSYVIRDPEIPTSITPIAVYTIPGFHQGADKATNRRDFVVSSVFSWNNETITAPRLIKNTDDISEAAKRRSRLLSEKELVFRVDMEGGVRFEFLVKSSVKKIMAWANIEVDGMSGKKINKKGIELEHEHVNKGVWYALGVVLCAFAIIVLPCVLVIYPILTTPEARQLLN